MEFPSLPIYLIYSRWSLHQIDNFLSQYGSVGYLRIILDKNGVETDRTMAIVSSETFEKLSKDGYHEHQPGKDFMITPFVLRKKPTDQQNPNRSLYVPVPKELTPFDVEVIDEINTRLVHFSQWGILSSNDWKVTAPLISREKGGIRNGCFITFKQHVSLETISLIRLLLTETYWRFTPKEITDPIRFSCFWSKQSQPSTQHRFPSSNQKSQPFRPPIKSHNSPKQTPPTEIKNVKDIKKSKGNRHPIASETNPTKPFQRIAKNKKEKSRHPSKPTDPIPLTPNPTNPIPLTPEPTNPIPLTPNPTDPIKQTEQTEQIEQIEQIEQTKQNIRGQNSGKKMEVPKRFQPKRLTVDPKPVLMVLPSLEQPSMM